MTRSAAARARGRGPGGRALIERGVVVRVAEQVAWLTLNRPRRGNRITPGVAQELCAAVEAIALDDSVALVVLAAAGRDFCLGVENGGAWEERMDWVAAVAGLACPVIGAIQGSAIAAGLELALACDLRLASSRAHFAMPQLVGGSLPAHGGTQRLPRLLGRARALDLLLSGRRMDAAEAEAVGLVSRVAPHRRFMPTLMELLHELQAKGPIALRYAKEAVLKGTDLTLDQGIRLEEDLYALLQTTRDRREGVDAFLKKRTPVFRGE